MMSRQLKSRMIGVSVSHNSFVLRFTDQTVTAIVQTHTRTHKRAPVRIIAALLTLLPAIMFGGLQLVATPDLEAWLTKIESHTYLPCCSASHQCSPRIVLSHKSRYLLPLATGPLLGLLLYLGGYGVTDPAWFTLLALLSIGMLVGTVVTVTWIVIRMNRH